jgi:hypothetical protein
MITQLNQDSSRVVITEGATLSRDGHTIERALMVDGVSYDIDIDFSKGDRDYYQSIIPKIQTIWARIAEKSLPNQKVSPNWEMKCSYDSRTERSSVVVLSEEGSKDLSDTILLNADKLEEELRETLTFQNLYAKNGIVTAHKIMKYVNNQLMRPFYVYNHTGFSSLPRLPDFNDTTLRPSLPEHKYLISDVDFSDEEDVPNPTPRQSSSSSFLKNSLSAGRPPQVPSPQPSDFSEADGSSHESEADGSSHEEHGSNLTPIESPSCSFLKSTLSAQLPLQDSSLQPVHFPETTRDDFSYVEYDSNSPVLSSKQPTQFDKSALAPRKSISLSIPPLVPLSPTNSTASEEDLRKQINVVLSTARNFYPNQLCTGQKKQD